jgi:hypothetical protein
MEGSMSKTTRCTFTIALALALVAASNASGGAVGGRTYVGGIPETGTKFEGHHGVGRTHAYGGLLSLHVSRSAQTVTVKFTTSWPVIYCYNTKQLRVQKTRAARISRAGLFNAAVEERFTPGPGLPPIVQVVSGRFRGRVVTGKVETRAPPCSGATTFYATAQ